MNITGSSGGVDQSFDPSIEKKNEIEKTSNDGTISSISHMTSKELSEYLATRDVIDGLWQVMEFVDKVQGETLAPLTTLLTHSKERQEQILAEQRSVKFAESEIPDGTKEDKQNLILQQTSEKNGQSQRILDNLNNQLTLEKSFAENINSATGKVNGMTNTIYSFLSDVFKNYQSGAQSITK